MAFRKGKYRIWNYYSLFFKSLSLNFQCLWYQLYRCARLIQVLLGLFFNGKTCNYLEFDWIFTFHYEIMSKEDISTITYIFYQHILDCIWWLSVCRDVSSRWLNWIFINFKFFFFYDCFSLVNLVYFHCTCIQSKIFYPIAPIFVLLLLLFLMMMMMLLILLFPKSVILIQLYCVFFFFKA